MTASTNLASIVAESAYRYPEKNAMVLGDIAVSYSALWLRARQYATVLREQGIKPGDRVALLVPNVPQFPMAYYGILALGAVVVPIHSLLVANEIEYAITDSESKALIVAGPLLEEGAEGAALAGVPAFTVMSDSDAFLQLDTAAASATPLAQAVTRSPADEAVILYTSGTTGAPKGAVLTHDNIMWNATLCAFDTLGIHHDDVLFAALPLFHSFGQVAVMNAAFRAGATLALVPRFDPATVMDVIESANVTLFAGVPTMFIALLAVAKADPRRPQFRMAVSGGASLPVAVIDAVKETFGADIYEGYGLSETSPVATFNQSHYGRKPGSVGRAVWGVDVEIAEADVEGEIILKGADEMGEIVIRGHNVFAGYLNKPEATAEVTVDDWFRTGDLGYKDEDGFVFIVDRKKDLIIRGGFNVYPREVEEVLMRHDAVAQVAVVATPHETHGEEITAVVVLVDGAEVSEVDLISWSQGELAKHKYPRVIHFVADLPLGPSGKILKREIVAKLAE
ncbi:MAG: long-chain fatty acid--CoA ligase [Actinomycetia bacterium]|nr:long-chain fatty acid--CoA ligase [Actinomycetes bacterium]